MKTNLNINGISFIFPQYLHDKVINYEGNNLYYLLGLLLGLRLL